MEYHNKNIITNNLLGDIIKNQVIKNELKTNDNTLYNMEFENKENKKLPKEI